MTRLIRFRLNKQDYWGELDLDTGEAFFINGSVYEKWERGNRAGNLNSLALLPPCEPKIVAALAYNFKDLVGKKNSYDEPLLFLKSPSTVISGLDPIVIPRNCFMTWVEVEIAIVLKKSLFKASVEEVKDAILGVTIANDVTTQNIANRDHHLARSKSQPTFCPVGNYLSTETDTDNLKMTTIINGVKTQDGNSRNRILNDYESLSLVSQSLQLFPGDLILTGTPAGAMSSLIKPGDSAILSIEKLGTLSNSIAEEK